MSRQLLKLISMPLLFVALFSPGTASADCANPAGIQGEMFYNGDFQVIQFCNGTNWIGMYGGSGGGGGGSGITDGDMGDISVSGSGASWMIDDDVLDFTEFKDALSLDASTDIAISGSQVFSLTNTGTSSSFVVNDQASDTTPFVIDAAGNVGVGITIPTQALEVAGKVKADSMIVKVQSGLAAPSGGLALGWSTDGTHVWRATGNVGVGTATPTQKLMVSSSHGTDQAVRFENTNAAATGRLLTLSQAGTAGDVLGVYSSGNARLYVTGGGNVGIGTTSPTKRLHIKTNEIGAATSMLRLDNGGTAGNEAGLEFWAAPTDAATSARTGRMYGAWDSGSYTGARLSFQSMTTGDVLVDTMHLKAGNVGIGTESPGALLHVGAGSNLSFNNGAGGASPAQILISQTSGVAMIGVVVTDGTHNSRAALFMNETSGVWGLSQTYNAGADYPFVLVSGGAERLRIVATTGNVGIGTTSPSYKLHVVGQVAGNAAYVNTSDARLKKDVADLNYGLSTIEKLRPVSFRWIEQKEEWQKGRKLGLLAQEAETIVPEVVTTANDMMGTKSIAYGDLTPVVIKAVQELKADNDNLREIVERQGREIEALKAAR